MKRVIGKVDEDNWLRYLHEEDYDFIKILKNINDDPEKEIRNMNDYLQREETKIKLLKMSQMHLQ